MKLIKEGLEPDNTRSEDMFVQNMIREIVITQFTKRFSHVFVDNSAYQYKDRLIFDNMEDTEAYIDFIDHLKFEYGINGRIASKMIIDKFGFEERV